MSNDIDLLAATAYETGISPLDYAVTHVIQSHIDVFLSVRDLGGEIGFALAADTAALSRRILADLLNAGCKLPEVTR